MKYFFGSIIGFVLLVIAFLIWSSLFGPAPQGPKPLLGEQMPDQGAPHVARGSGHPAYNSDPPTSGWHWGDGVAGGGVKTEQVADELVLHSMEHGAAVLWYKSDLSQEEVAQIRAAYDAARIAKKIMIPRANLDVPVALTSWRYLLKLDAIDAARITAFLETNNNRAPENAPI